MNHLLSGHRLRRKLRLAAQRRGYIVMAFYIVFEKALAVVRRRNGEWRVDLHLAGNQPQCLAVDPLQPAHVYCGTFDRGLWRSADALHLLRLSKHGHM